MPDFLNNVEDKAHDNDYGINETGNCQWHQWRRLNETDCGRRRRSGQRCYPLAGGDKLAGQT
jgi:hypothetical protein